MNRREFPIDEPVWFNPDDVALGIDPILTKACSWISTLSYAYNIVLSKDSIVNSADSILITAKVRNPGNHNLIVSANIINGQGSPVDSTFLLPVSGDSLWGSYIIPGETGTYYVSVKTEDITAGTYRILPAIAFFTVIISSIEDRVGTLPLTFDLQQNYPNPFNPNTVISYQLPASNDVTLKVFDILGNEIETLVNEEKPAGTYEVSWNADNLPSGVYFYRIQAGNFINTKKMILLK